MSLFEGFFAGFSDFAATVGDIATDLQPVADLYGSVTGGGAPAYDLGSILPSVGGGAGYTPGFVPAGTGSSSSSQQGPTPSGEPLGSSSSGVVLIGVLLVVILLSRR